MDITSTFDIDESYKLIFYKLSNKYFLNVLANLDIRNCSICGEDNYCDTWCRGNLTYKHYEITKNIQKYNYNFNISFLMNIFYINNITKNYICYELNINNFDKVLKNQLDNTNTENYILAYQLNEKFNSEILRFILSFL
jgi:hypothetical protein